MCLFSRNQLFCLSFCSALQNSLLRRLGSWERGWEMIMDKWGTLVVLVFWLPFLGLYRMRRRCLSTPDKLRFWCVRLEKQNGSWRRRGTVFIALHTRRVVVMLVVPDEEEVVVRSSQLVNRSIGIARDGKCIKKKNERSYVFLQQLLSKQSTTKPTIIIIVECGNSGNGKICISCVSR